MGKIEFIQQGEVSTAKVIGGMIVRFENGDNDRNGSYYGCSMVFVPDPRITLAGQIAAGLLGGEYYPKADFNDYSIAHDAIAIADEILRQAAEIEAKS